MSKPLKIRFSKRAKSAVGRYLNFRREKLAGREVSERKSLGPPRLVKNAALAERIQATPRTFGHWVNLNLIPFSGKPPERPKRIVREAREIKRGIRMEHPNWTAGRIHRPVRFWIDRRTNTLNVELGRTDYLTMLSSYKGKQAKRIRPELARSRIQFMKIPYLFSSNVILEVCNAQGKPTHIVMFKRPKTVAVLPEYYDFPAGVVRANSNPIQTALSRMEREVGVKSNELSFLGPGLRKSVDQHNPPVFTVQLTEELSGVNLIYVARTSLTAEEIEKRVKSLGENVKLVPITSNALGKMASGKTVFPPALKMYAKEAAKAGK